MSTDTYYRGDNCPKCHAPMRLSFMNHKGERALPVAICTNRRPEAVPCETAIIVQVPSGPDPSHP